MKTARYFILPCLALLLFINACETEKSSVDLQSGKLSKISGCGKLKSSLIEEDTADSLSCIEYSYDAENKKLLLKHINAGFNCCPEKIYGDVGFVDDSVIIQESEKDGLCDCNCLYNLEFELTGISKKAYVVCLIEPYAGDQEEIAIRIDLTENTQGSYCVVRKGYPWGLNNQ